MIRLNRTKAPALAAVVLLPLSLAANPASAVVPAKAGKQTVSGTLKWTIVTTTTLPGDSSTVTEKHSLGVKAVRDPQYTQTYTFKQGKASYTYNYSMQRQTSTDGCSSSTEGNATGSGKTKLSPDLLRKYRPNETVPVIDKRTKGIVVHAVFEGTGTQTLTQRAGGGANPCGDYSRTDPLTVNGSTVLQDSRNFCLPKGLKASAVVGRLPLFGKWNQKSKKFTFDCSQEFTDAANGMTTKLIVTGFLKYKR